MFKIIVYIMLFLDFLCNYIHCTCLFEESFSIFHYKYFTYYLKYMTTNSELSRYFIKIHCINIEFHCSFFALFFYIFHCKLSKYDLRYCEILPWMTRQKNCWNIWKGVVYCIVGYTLGYSGFKSWEIHGPFFLENRW